MFAPCDRSAGVAVAPAAAELEQSTTWLEQQDMNTSWPARARATLAYWARSLGTSLGECGTMNEACDRGARRARAWWGGLTIWQHRGRSFVRMAAMHEEARAQAAGGRRAWEIVRQLVELPSAKGVKLRVAPDSRVGRCSSRKATSPCSGASARAWGAHRPALSCIIGARVNLDCPIQPCALHTICGHESV